MCPSLADEEDEGSQGRQAVGGGGIHNYTIVGKIAHGGQGQILLIERKLHPNSPLQQQPFSAEKQQVQKQFAMKVIPCATLKDRSAALLEFELMQLFQGNPNMVELVDMFLHWEGGGTSSSSGSGIHQGANSLNDSSPLLLSQQERELDSLTLRSHHQRGDLDVDVMGARFVAIVTKLYPEGSLTKFMLHRLGSLPNAVTTTTTTESHGELPTNGRIGVTTSAAASGAVATPRQQNPTRTASYRMPENVLMTIILQIGSILSSMHSHQPWAVAHLDIKPDNVLVSSAEGRVVLTDFGLAAKIPARTGMIERRTGTHSFLAPETAAQGICSVRSDIWSLGCLLYALATQRINPDRGARNLFREVKDADFHEEIYAELHEDWSYSEHVASLCVAMLQHEGNARPTINEVLQRISMIPTFEAVRSFE